MGQFDKKQSVYILVIILAVLQLFFNRNNPLPKVSLISPTNSPVPSPTTIITPSEKQLVKVVRAIDGDTVEIEGNIKVRYIGINTPELHDPRRPVQCYGQISADENKKLVEGKEVYIQKDVSEVDKYKRLLRYVWVGDPSTGSGQVIFVNDYLVRQGFAQVSTFPPDVKYVSQFLEAQKEAMENKRGLWKDCPTDK
ncbi:MAG: Nuclease-like protein [Candidatus Daviesbacteria bacterium GW2011_GWA2_38_24]|uniref:Nuclease-like protein n=1 Tax=Candidatus Daviesbacteria bacterium GW2011_GWA2_38_24 TaxID=1618422 RepID=A0A0G0MIE0_9BACT|nr:MAG: Nuclease-like protein [Candidatus Daviesbacteria bacterium GW2011_GWA2_38_24]